jgi:hypothetical protein
MINRRNFLKTSAATSGALVLPSFGGTASKPDSGSAPRRFIFIRKSNGLRPKDVALPTFSEEEKNLDNKKQPLEVDLDKHELPTWFSPLVKHKANISILQGLSCKMSENGHFSFSSVMGAYKSGRNSLSGIKRATIDFELAKLFPSAFGHVELSFAGGRKGIVSGYSAPSAHQRNYCYADPQTAYDELFKAVTNPSAIDSDSSMLQFLQAEEDFKAQRLLGYEKLKLSNHISSIEAIRARNSKLEKMSDTIAKHLPTIDPIHANGGAKANTPEKQKAMTDVLASALVTGLTNVVTYTIDDLGTPIVGLPGNESDNISIHSIGHNGAFGGVSADDIREKMRKGHMEQVATIIERLQATPEVNGGKGNMFDNTMIMYFPEGGEAHHGHGTESPVVVLAGDNCKLDISGRYIRLPYHGTEGHKTIGNWYTTLLNAYGNPIEHYGDFDLEMARKKFDQVGAIKQFMA